MHDFAFRRLVFATLALASATAAQANSYHLVDLGPNVQAFRINKHGDVAGASFDPNTFIFRAIVYRGGRWKNLRNDAFNSAAEDVNDGGDVLGTLNYAADSVAALWPRGGGLQTIPLPPNGHFATGAGISEDGTIVGSYELRNGHGDNYHCYRWTAAGGTVDLGLMANGRTCDALGINRAGVIVGVATINPKGAQRAFRYENGTFRNLGLLPGTRFSTAYAINNQGHIVGDSTGHAFLWSGGAMKDIGDSVNYLGTYASSINDHGSIVGRGTSRADGNDHALRYADGKAIPLESEVDDLADWQLNEATSVNEDGVIVGLGNRTDGPHSFELVPTDARAPGSR